MCESFTIEQLHYVADTGQTCVEFQDPTNPADCFSEYFDFQGIDIYKVIEELRCDLNDMDYSQISYIAECAAAGDSQEVLIKKSKLLKLMKFHL